MKKVLLLSLLLSAFIQPTNAQVYAMRQLNANNISARINSYGVLFHTIGSPGTPGFEASKGSGRHSIYSSNLWIGGQQMGSGVIHAASQVGVAQNDFQPGPVMDPSAYATRLIYWNDVWMVSRTEIQNHIDHYTDAGYTVPYSIASWPGNGDITYGEPDKVAPYVDANGNGTYDPVNGDYPLIKGDVATFQVFNDDHPHSLGTQPMRIEVRCMTYAFDCNLDSALQNTVFVNYQIINRGTGTYQSTYAAIYLDTDIGYGNDDYMGCDVARGMFYGYNGDALDNTATPILGYGNLLPVQGITFLAGPYQDSDGIENPITNNYTSAVDSAGIVYPGLGLNYESGYVDDERLGLRSFHLYDGGIPASSTELYYLLQGLKADGSSNTHGSSSTLCGYDYADNTDPLYWSTHGVSVPDLNETGAGNTPDERRGIGSMGPFTMTPGSLNEIDLAYTFASTYASSTPLNALPLLQDRTDDIRSYFITGHTPCGDFTNGIGKINPTTGFSVYPNPVSQILNVQVKTPGVTTYTIYDVFGKLVGSGQLNGLNTTINVSTLQEGIYFIRLDASAAQKFVVQH